MVSVDCYFSTGNKIKKLKNRNFYVKLTHCHVNENVFKYYTVQLRVLVRSMFEHNCVTFMRMTLLYYTYLLVLVFLCPILKAKQMQ